MRFQLWLFESCDLLIFVTLNSDVKVIAFNYLCQLVSFVLALISCYTTEAEVAA